MSETFRERLRRSRRQRRLRLLRFLLIAALLAAAATGLYRWLHQPGRALGGVEIGGSTQVTEEDVLQIAGIEAPFNCFNVSAAQVEKVLRQDVRFKNVRASYSWPWGILKIDIEERQPALYVANAYQSYLQLDYDGLVIKVTAGLPDAKAPLLVGEDCGNVFVGDTIANERVAAILSFLRQLDGAARAKIAEIAVDDRHFVTVSQRDSFPIRLGAAAQIPAKAGLYMTVFNEIKDRKIDALYIDLSFGKPYIKFKGSAPTAAEG